MPSATEPGESICDAPRARTRGFLRCCSSRVGEDQPGPPWLMFLAASTSAVVRPQRWRPNSACSSRFSVTCPHWAHVREVLRASTRSTRRPALPALSASRGTATNPRRGSTRSIRTRRPVGQEGRCRPGSGCAAAVMPLMSPAHPLHDHRRWPTPKPCPARRKPPPRVLGTSASMVRGSGHRSPWSADELVAPCAVPPKDPSPSSCLTSRHQRHTPHQRSATHPPRTQRRCLRAPHHVQHQAVRADGNRGTPQQRTRPRCADDVGRTAQGGEARSSAGFDRRSQTAAGPPRSRSSGALAERSMDIPRSPAHPVALGSDLGYIPPEETGRKGEA